MRHFKIVCVIILCISYSNLNAQFKKKKSIVIASLEISDARANGSDISPEALEEKAFLVFYKSIDGKENMLANCWTISKSQSFGPIYSIVKEDNIDAAYKTETYHFQWKYANTYDDIKGTASIKLVVVYKPEGNYYELTLFTEFIEVLLYSGILKGDLTSLYCKI